MQTQRTTNDRNHRPDRGSGDLLLHQGRGQGLVCEHSGLRGPIDSSDGANGEVPAKAGGTSRAWEAASSDGRDRRLTCSATKQTGFRVYRCSLAPNHAIAEHVDVFTNCRGKRSGFAWHGPRYTPPTLKELAIAVAVLIPFAAAAVVIFGGAK